MKYQYKCKSCGHFETIEQSIHAEPITMCPCCKDADNFYRVIKSANFMVIGEGWTSREKSGMYHRKDD